MADIMTDYTNRSGGTASVADTSAGAPQPSVPPPATPDAEATPDTSAIPAGNRPGAAAMAPEAAMAKPQQQQPQPHSVFQSILGVLAGPQFKYDIDPNTGKMNRVPVQRTKSQLANSIVAGALTGMFSGLGQSGPDAEAKAFAAGGQAGMKRAQQGDAQAQQEATDNFGRKASILENNLRLRMNAAQLADMDYNLQNKVVAGNKELLDKAKEVDGLLDGGAEYTAAELPEILKKYNVTQQSALMSGLTLRMNPDGTIAKGTNGENLYDPKFVIIDPSVKTELPAGLKEFAVGAGLPGFSSNGKAANLPADAKARLYVIANAQHVRDMYEMSNQNLQSYWKQVDEVNGKKGKSGDTEKMPELPEDRKEIQDIADREAEAQGVPKGLVRALIMQESGGDPKAQSKAGAVGVMQLMPDTAKGLGVTDATDPEQNIKAGVAYLKQQLDKYKDPKLALAAYNAGPGNVTDHVPQNSETPNYVNAIMSSIGGIKEPEDKDADSAVGSSAPNLMEKMKNDPALVKALEAFQRFHGMPLDKALAEMRKPEYKINPEYAGKIAQLYGGDEMVRKISAEQERKEKAADLEANMKVELKKYQAQTDIRDKADKEYSEEQAKMLKVPEGFDTEDKTLKTLPLTDLKKKLESSGVTIPDKLATLYGIAHYKTELRGTVPVRVSKGTRQLDAGTAAAYIRQFINPDFDENEFAAARKFQTEMASDRAGTSGGMVSAASTATQHLDLVGQAFDALNNNDIQKLNSLANSFGVQIGKDAKTTFDAIAHQAASEVGKVVTGAGQVTDAEKETLGKNLNSSLSPDQLHGVIKAYIGLLKGRLDQIDNESVRYTGHHIDKLADRTNRVWHRYGLNTPWAEFKAPEGAPAPPAQDNKYLNFNGLPIAVSKGGKWVPMEQ